MHLVWDVSIGNIVTFIMVLGAIWRIEKFVSIFRVEHEMVVNWYCESKGISKRDLPTRSLLGTK